MKLVIRRLFFTVALSLSFSSYADVTISINSTQFDYPANPRLAEVLEPVALQQKWYWPAAALFKLSDNTAELQRQQVMALIDELKQKYASDKLLSASMSAVAHQVSSWQLATRVPVAIDYDFARARVEHNPRFEDGSYQLFLTQRPTKVFMFGAVKTTVSLRYRNAAKVADYLVQLPLLPDADSSHVYILQTNGQIVKVGIASWNQKHTEAAPGAQIFIPFNTQLFSSDMTRLNQEILALAVHRVLL